MERRGARPKIHMHHVRTNKRSNVGIANCSIQELFLQKKVRDILDYIL
jgi:hypothetical protein